MISAKRALTVGAFILSVFAIGAAMFVLFFRSQAPETPPVVVDPLTGTTGTLPVSGEGAGVVTTPPASAGNGSLPQGGVSPTTNPVEVKSTVLINKQVRAPKQSQNGLNYYDSADGRFYRVDTQGTITSLSDKTFPSVSEITWNNPGEKAILEFPDGSNILFDFTTEEQVSFPKHWEDFSFAPSGETLAAKSLGLDAESRWLVVTSSDGSHTKAVQALGENADKVVVSWAPNENVVGFANTVQRSGGSLEDSLYIPIGQNQENFPGIRVEGLGFEPRWSPSGSHLLYSSYSDYSNNKPLLWVVNGRVGELGSDRRSIALNTWADKCTFGSGDVAYCAVPETLPSNAAINRSRYSNTSDLIYRVELNTGRTALVARPELSTTMNALELSSDGRVLFFQNGLTGNLESIPLP